MAKAKGNRPAQQEDEPKDLPGGEAYTPEENEEGGVKEQEEPKRNTRPSAEQDRLERALLHLDYLVDEVKALTADRTKTSGPMRRSAGRRKQTFDGPVDQWPPFKLIRGILSDALAEITPPQQEPPSIS